MKEPHWTNENIETYIFCILSDFLSQIRQCCDFTDIISKKTGIPEKEVYRIFERPEKKDFETIIQILRALDLQAGIVVYKNDTPIIPDIFRKCWERQDAPKDFWELRKKRYKK